MACARDGPVSRWGIDGRIRGRGARCVLILLPVRMSRRVDDEASVKLFHDSSFDLTHVLFSFSRTHEVDWSEAFFVGWFSYSFAEGAVERVEAFQCSAEHEILMGNGCLRKLFWKLSLPGCQQTILDIVTLNQR